MLFQWDSFLFGILLGMVIWIVCLSFNKIDILLLKKEKKNIEPNKNCKNILSSVPFRNHILALSFIVPNTITEELLFRSYLLSLTDKYMSVILSIAVNVIFFFLIHLDKRVLQLAVSSMGYCIITIMTDNILPALAAHLTYNLIVYSTKKNVIL